MQSAETDTTLKWRSAFMERIGTRVPHSSGSVVWACASVLTPKTFADSAIHVPSAGLPSYANAMLLMKCGSSLLV